MQPVHLEYVAQSHVLRAMNLSEDLIESSLRIGLGKFTCDREIEEAAEILSEAIRKVRQVMFI